MPNLNSVNLCWKVFYTRRYTWTNNKYLRVINNDKSVIVTVPQHFPHHHKLKSSHKTCSYLIFISSVTKGSLLSSIYKSHLVETCCLLDLSVLCAMLAGTPLHSIPFFSKFSFSPIKVLYGWTVKRVSSIP